MDIFNYAATAFDETSKQSVGVENPFEEVFEIVWKEVTNDGAT